VSGVALLDVNVLVALFDPDHVHHDAAHQWFAASREPGWATCPLTENGVVRILSNPAYSGTSEATDSVVRRLSAFCASGQHVFWDDSLSIRDERIFKRPLPISHRQLTDVYLLGLAKSRGGRIASFDRRIPLGAVIGAGAGHLELIPA
jgi:toxin-antitoxin system PIN domain toxin